MSEDKLPQSDSLVKLTLDDCYLAGQMAIAHVTAETWGKKLSAIWDQWWFKNWVNCDGIGYAEAQYCFTCGFLKQPKPRLITSPVNEASANERFVAGLMRSRLETEEYAYKHLAGYSKFINLSLSEARVIVDLITRLIGGAR